MDESITHLISDKLSRLCSCLLGFGSGWGADCPLGHTTYLLRQHLRSGSSLRFSCVQRSPHTRRRGALSFRPATPGVAGPLLTEGSTCSLRSSPSRGRPVARPWPTRPDGGERGRRR